MSRIGLVIVLASCGPSPGETRCSTTNVYGTAYTSCKTEPPEQVTAPKAVTFWCTTRDLDGFGMCAAEPGPCEDQRAKGIAGCAGSPGNCPRFSPCEYRTYAICASSGCFTTPESCARAERMASRPAAGCVLRR